MHQEERQHRHARPRLETLSDLIYGLSLSIGAISLVITNSTQSNAIDIDRNILEFLFLFLILITSWIIYTSDMSVLPVETRLVTFLNVILLILVAIIPYLFDQAVSLYNTAVDQDYASILFTIDYAGTLLILAGFAHIISQEEKQLVDGDQMVRLRRIRNRLTLLTIVVLLSLSVTWNCFFLGVHGRLLIWYVPIVSFWSNEVYLKKDGVLSENLWRKPVINVFDDSKLDGSERSLTRKREGYYTRFLMPLLGPGRTAFRVEVIENGESSARLHSHSEVDEYYLILEGSGTLRFNDKEIAVHRGDLIGKRTGPDDASHLNAG